MPKTDYVLRRRDLWKTTTQGLPDKMKGIVNDKVWNQIRLNPYNSEYLRLELEGLRSFKLQSGHRIIFAICKECRKGGFESLNNCGDCGERSENTIMLFAFGSHDIYDFLERKRMKARKKAQRKKRSQLRRR